MSRLNYQSEITTFSPEEGRIFAKETKHKLFKYSNAGKVFSRTFRDNSIEIFPGIFSTDDTYLKFVSELAKRLHDNFPKTVLENGFFDKTAISTNFQELNTVAGLKSKPIGYSMIGNDSFRRERKLASGFVKERHKKIFDEFMAECYDGYKTKATGKISQISSSGFPLFVSDVEYKLLHLNKLSENIRDILDRVEKRDLNGLWDKYSLTFCGVLSIRSQYDGWTLENGRFTPKVRYVHDDEYALSGGVRGLRFPADKKVTIEGHTYPDKATNRIRGVSAKPSTYNNIGTAWFEGLRSYSDSKFEQTWKHRGREDIEAKVARYDYVLGLDVTEYDRSMPYWLFDEWIKALPINENMRDFMRLGMLSPSFYPSQGEEPDPLWTGNPFDISYYNQYAGLPSGIFFTSALGKIGFTWAVLCMIDDLTGDVLGNINEILNHRHPDYAISNMGDDTLLHSNSKNLIDRLTYKNEHSINGMSDYFVVDVEEGVRFLGNVGYIDENGNIKLAGDIATYLGNMLVPERSINSKMRKYGVYGLLERRNVYNDNPSFEAVDQIFQSTFNEFYGYNWFDLMEANLVLPADDSIDVRSFADLEVLLDPSKLYYKYETSDISSDIVSKVQTTIPEEIANKIRNAVMDAEFLDKIKRNKNEQT
jgi:hypothetical protein